VAEDGAETRPFLVFVKGAQIRLGQGAGANHCMLLFTKICIAVQSIEQARSIALSAPPAVDM
jgi:hypothetical protein